MKITREKLSQVAGNFLEVLDKEGIGSLNDIDHRLNRNFPIGGGLGEVLEISLRPSHSTVAHTMSYIIPRIGIPIEVRMHKALGLSHIIIKTSALIPSYEAFAEDRLGNVIQNKPMVSTDLRYVRGELEKLRGE